MRCTSSGANRAAMGSTLLRSPGSSRPVQYECERHSSIQVPCGPRQAIEISRKALLLRAWRRRRGAHAPQTISREMKSCPTNIRACVLFMTQ